MYSRARRTNTCPCSLLKGKTPPPDFGVRAGAFPLELFIVLFVVVGCVAWLAACLRMKLFPFVGDRSPSRPSVGQNDFDFRLAYLTPKFLVAVNRLGNGYVAVILDSTLRRSISCLKRARRKELFYDGGEEFANFPLIFYEQDLFVLQDKGKRTDTTRLKKEWCHYWCKVTDQGLYFFISREVGGNTSFPFLHFHQSEREEFVIVADRSLAIRTEGRIDVPSSPPSPAFVSPSL